MESQEVEQPVASVIQPDQVANADNLDVTGLDNVNGNSVTQNEAPATTSQEATNQTIDEALNIPKKLPSTTNLAKKEVKAEQFSSAKSLIQETKVYDHLSHIILKILQLKPKDAYGEFEMLSQLVKKEQSVVPGAPLNPAEVNVDERKFADLLNSTVKDAHTVTAEIPDLLTLSRLFTQAGVNISTEETYRLLQGMKKVEQTFECKSVRFFGKVFGAKSDYYIFESERSTNEEVPLIGDVPAEQGMGSNKYVYFVSSNGVDGWKKLPDAQPLYIQKSRKIRKLLTGNLETKLKSQPDFEGTEADYLRSLIARISSTTVISPNGYYKFDEDEEGVVVLNTDFEWPSPDSLFQLDNWVHHVSYLLPQGRTTFVQPNKAAAEEEKNESEDAEQEEEEASNIETGPPLLSPISEDRPMKHDITCWTIKPAFQHLQLKHSAVVLRNNLWPGAVTVGFNDKFANLYIGWGLKELGELYVPEDCGLEQSEYNGEAFIEQEEADPPAEEKMEGEEAEDGEEEP